ncbi:UNVERIFIED_CONTAM: hypothetical protein RMT77_017097 [Armadillidium vulgare]
MNNLWMNSSSDEEELQCVLNVNKRIKKFRLRINFNFENSAEFQERFRMSPLKTEQLLQEIGWRLEHRTNKSGALSPKQQLCVALHWFGSGVQYHIIGDMHGINKSTVCRTVANVVRVINRHIFNKIISWPANIGEVLEKFYEIANFPQVCGIIDGSLIPIDAPTVNEEAFVDRKG